MAELEKGVRNVLSSRRLNLLGVLFIVIFLACSGGKGVALDGGECCVWSKLGVIFMRREKTKSLDLARKKKFNNDEDYTRSTLVRGWDWVSRYTGEY